MSLARQVELEHRHNSYNQSREILDWLDGVFPQVPKRDLPMKIITMVVLYRRLPFEALVNLFLHEDTQEVADVCEGLVRSRWIHWDEEREEFVTLVIPQELEVSVFQKRYPLPLVIHPRVMTEETESPYYTEERRSPVLGEYNEQRTNLLTLNLLNATPLKLDRKIVDDPSVDPFGIDQKFREDSQRVFEVLGEETFYLTWEFDFRGRVYARGYHVNPQGDSWHKNTVLLADT